MDLACKVKNVKVCEPKPQHIQAAMSVLMSQKNARHLYRVAYCFEINILLQVIIDELFNNMSSSFRLGPERTTTDIICLLIFTIFASRGY